MINRVFGNEDRSDVYVRHSVCFPQNLNQYFPSHGALLKTRTDDFDKHVKALCLLLDMRISTNFDADLVPKKC